MLAGKSIGPAKEELLIMKRLAMALVFALLISFQPMSSSAAPTARQIVESRLTVTFTQTVEGTGSTRTISSAVTVVDSQGELSTVSPTGNQIQISLIGFSVYLCSSPVVESQLSVNTPSGCRPVPSFANTASTNSPQSVTIVRNPVIRFVDPYLSSYPYMVPRLIVTDASGNRFDFTTNWTRIPLQSESSDNGLSPLDAPVVASTRHLVSQGEIVQLAGRNMDEVESVLIGSEPISMLAKDSESLSFEIPRGIQEGIYDLVLNSRFGALTIVNYLDVKPPTPTRSLKLRGLGQYLDETHAKAITTFQNSLGGGYDRIRCIANSRDAAVARSIATRVCANIARGELRNVEVTHEVRTTFKGSGFWVRVYATG
jgi:hypothetical protein